MGYTPLGAMRYPLGEHTLDDPIFLDDLEDVFVPDPDPWSVLYWDDETSLWKAGDPLDVIEEFNMEAAGGAPYVVPDQIVYTYQAAGSDNFVVNLPDHLTTGNQLLAVILCKNWLGAVNTPAGWTYIGIFSNTSQARGQVYCRTIDGSEGATQTFVYALGDIVGMSAAVFEIADALDLGAFPSEQGGDATGNSVYPKSETMTPTNGNCWLYITMFVHQSAANVSDYPEDWDYLFGQYADAEGDLFGWAMTRSFTTPCPDPPRFTVNNANGWAAGTVAVPGTLQGLVDNMIWGYDGYDEAWRPQEWFELELAHIDHKHYGDEGTVLAELTDLTNVTTDAVPADNEVLAWDDGTQEWINQTAAEAGLSVDTHDHDGDYSPLGHDHDLAYAAIGHDHDLDYADIAHVHALDDLSDVDAAAPDDGDVLTYDDGSGDWVPAPPPAGGALDLDDLTDVNAPAPDDGDVLTWNDVASEWQASAPPAGGAMDLDDLTDVDINAPDNYDILMYDNGDWINYPMLESMLLDSLYDVTITDVTDGELLVFDSYSNEWINQTLAEAGIMPSDAELADLDDVTITGVADNEVLAYDSGTGDWINQTASEAGLAAATHLHTVYFPFCQAGELETTTDTGAFRLYLPHAMTITKVGASCGVAPTGAAVIVDVHKDGTTIFSTQANRPEIAASGYWSGWETPDVTAFAADSYLTVNIDQIGSTLPGENLTVIIYATRSA